MKNLKEKILNEISEMEIFERYLGFQVKLGKIIISPLRQEKHPSFNIYQSATNGKLYYKDFGDERGDCFSFIMKLYNCSFNEALYLVANDFGIDTSKKEEISGIRRIVKNNWIPQFFIKTRKKLPYARDEWNESNYELWKKCGISIDILKEYNVWPVKKMKIQKLNNNDSFILHSKENDPIYCFDYGNEAKKFYRPNVLNKKYKFISNLTKDDIFGLKQLRDHVAKSGNKEKLVIICAGQKDCLSLYSNTGIRGVSLNSESASVSNQFFINLMQYTENILVCYDNDNTGIKHSQKIKDEIGIDNIDLGVLAPPEIVNDIYDYFSKGFKKEEYLDLIKQKICL